MPLTVGQILKGRSASYKLLEPLKNSSVFKAAILSTAPNFQSNASTEKLAVIKAEPLEDRRKVVYEREYENHQNTMIMASPYIRALEDCIGHDEEKLERRCLVLEWMDTDLWKARMNPRSHDPQLQKNVARSVLEALAVFADIQGTHTDINPNNVLVSGIEKSNPIVKVGDLGNLCGEGIDWVRLQGLAIRAPEVWRGLGVWPASDVWSLGVTMAHWLAKRPIFGASDKILDGLTEAWCIAKMKRLVGPIGPPVKPEYAEDFETADYLELESFQTPEMTERRKFIIVGTIRQELERLPADTISKECIDFIESLLIIDYTKRPSARDALKHPFIAQMD